MADLDERRLALEVEKFEHEKKRESNTRRAETIRHSVTVAGLLLPILSAIAGYFVSEVGKDRERAQRDRDNLAVQQAVNKERAFEARKPYFEMQRLYCVDAVETATTIAVKGPDPQEEAAARIRFWRLYWGKMAIVEGGNAILQAMIAYGRELEKFDELLASNAGAAEVESHRKNLRLGSLNLGKACQTVILDTWLAK